MIATGNDNTEKHQGVCAKMSQLSMQERLNPQLSMQERRKSYFIQPLGKMATWGLSQ